ncbi:MAG: V-type ATP synthase subunit K [Desulfurococcales archaeon]|nr:V-type ATP synthase subunit K [Desulfurococcales archaeon]
MIEVVRALLSSSKGRILLLVVAVFASIMALSTGALIAAAQEGAATTGEASATGLKAIGAAIAVGAAGIGGGYAVGVAGAAAISAIAEKRELMGAALLFVVLGEGIAIYGLLVALIVLFVI